MLTLAVIMSLALAWLTPAVNAGAENDRGGVQGLWFLDSTTPGLLPAYLAGHAGFQNSSTKPIESRARFQFAERRIMLKSSYLERNLLVDPLVGENRRRPIFSISATSDLVGNLLKGETEFAHNALDVQTAHNLGRKTAALFRVGAKGEWHEYKYGAEYRSVDKGFMHFKGGEAGRGEESGQIWGERGLGPLRVRANFTQLWERLNESPETPRLTRSSALSLHHRKGQWETVLSSAYSHRVDRFRDGSVADLLSYELRMTYQPIKDLKITPMIRYASDWNRTVGIRSEMPSASLTLTYSSWRNILNFITSTTYHGIRSSDRLSHRQDFGSVTKIIWNFDSAFDGRKTLTYEFSYNSHRDLVARGNSKDGLAAKILLTVHRF